RTCASLGTSRSTPRIQPCHLPPSGARTVEAAYEAASRTDCSPFVPDFKHRTDRGSVLAFGGALLEQVAAEHERVHAGLQIVLDRLVGRVHDRLAAQVVGRVQYDRDAGPGAERVDEPVEGGIAVSRDALQAPRAVDVRHRRDDVAL